LSTSRRANWHFGWPIASSSPTPYVEGPLSARERPNKSVFYPGLKEELYIGDFEPDRAIVSRLGIERSPGEVVVAVRTAPTRALYHRFSNPLFIETLRVLENEPNVRLVILPRHAEQRQAVHDLHLRNCVIPAAAIDARSLMYAADLVIGAGGQWSERPLFWGSPRLACSTVPNRPSISGLSSAECFAGFAVQKRWCRSALAHASRDRSRNSLGVASS
jgi:predicted glycosyltransferase